MLEITCQVAFLSLLTFYSSNTLNVVQTWFVWHETWHRTLISIYYCFEMVRIEKIGMCLKLRFYVVLIYFYSFSFGYTFTMNVCRDEIVPEVQTSDNGHHSDNDKNYDPGMEKA